MSNGPRTTATGHKPQASSRRIYMHRTRTDSLKQQATSFKPQAASVKLQAASDKLHDS